MLCSAVQLYTNEYARFLFRLPSSFFLLLVCMHACMRGWDLVVVVVVLLLLLFLLFLLLLLCRGRNLRGIRKEREVG